jgi:hypothetical protein
MAWLGRSGGSTKPFVLMARIKGHGRSSGLGLGAPVCAPNSTAAEALGRGAALLPASRRTSRPLRTGTRTPRPVVRQRPHGPPGCLQLRCERAAVRALIADREPILDAFRHPDTLGGVGAVGLATRTTIRRMGAGRISGFVPWNPDASESAVARRRLRFMLWARAGSRPCPCPRSRIGRGNGRPESAQSGGTSHRAAV